MINSFLLATQEVLKSMAALEVMTGKPCVKRSENALGDVSGVIGLTGDAIGSLAISFSITSICEIAGRILGEFYQNLNGDVLDCVGELTNMICGVARTKVEKEGLRVYASIPSVVYGSAHTVKHILDGPSIVIPFSSEVGSFVLDMCVRRVVNPILNVAKNEHLNARKAARISVGDNRKEDTVEGVSVREDLKDSPLTRRDKIELMRAKLKEMSLTREALIKQLNDNPLLSYEKRKTYKKALEVCDQRIRRLKLDIAALEMIEKMSPEELENPKIVSHYQHYTKRK
ncbi:MAG: chemotaxis protein CheX [Syntrophales bacterium]|nr:chemotaxis protein CheX [Syntrophales bacterium]